MNSVKEGTPSEPQWADLDRAARQIRTRCHEGEMVWRIWGGGGRPLVLLHGGAGSWLHWVHTIPAFAGERTVVVPDLPGLGGSAKPPAGASGPEIAAIVATGIAEAVGADQPYDLAGFSFGGVMAGLLAAQGTTRPRTVTLVGSGGLGLIRSNPPLERVRDKTGDERMAAHRTNLHRWMIADPSRIDPLAIAIQDWNSRHARLDSRPVGTSDLLLSALPRIEASVAGIWGGRDHAVQGETDRVEATLHGLRPEAVFEVIPGAGHWVAYEAPRAFEGALRAAMDQAA